MRSRLLLVALTWTLAAAPPAAAKEDVRARLENPAALVRAKPGQRVRVAWTLSAAPRLPAGSGRASGDQRSPFGASGVYLRADRPGGVTAQIVPARSRAGSGLPAGRYAVTITVPRGGIEDIAIGLEGYRYILDNPPVRADVFFPIDNDPFAYTTAFGLGGLLFALAHFR